MDNKTFELNNNQVVKIANGMFGVVVSFNNKPSHIVFTSFTNPIEKWDSNLEHKSANYSIVEVYDGSTLASPLDAFKKCTKVEETLPLLYKK
jgi:hypothetical protein